MQSKQSEDFNFTKKDLANLPCDFSAKQTLCQLVDALILFNGACQRNGWDVASRKTEDLAIQLIEVLYDLDLEHEQIKSLKPKNS